MRIDMIIKANEVPEKIYLFKNPITETPDDRWLFKRSDESDIEYTRTDAFIEKALKWYCLDCECNDNCNDTKCFFYHEYERYLKGDTDAIPPKISNSILNEDGSASDDYYYRHFIKRMQDAFIDKACDWLKNNARNYYSAYATEDKLIEDFKKAMEEKRQ